MQNEIVITKEDVSVVLGEWLDQPGTECSDLSDLDACVDYVFDSLERLTKERTENADEHIGVQQ